MDKAKLKTEMDARYASIVTLRDEVRVKLHLLGMDARTALAELETKAEHLSQEVNEASHRGLIEVAEHLERIARTIRGSARA